VARLITSSNIDQFSNYFSLSESVRRKFSIILLLKISPYLNCVATLPCEMIVVLKATIENKTTSVTKHLKKLTTGNIVRIVSVMI